MSDKKFNENGVQIYDYYIYRVTLVTDGRTYIGKRYISLWFTPADGMDKYTPGEYYGSGEHIKNTVKCYGVDNFSREIIDEYHDITDEDIKVIEKFYILAEWEVGHGEFNYTANSFGGNLFEGLPNDKLLEIKSKLSASIRRRFEDGTHPFLNLTPKQLSERSRKAMATMGPEGLHNRAMTRVANTTHDQRSEWARKAIDTLGPEGLSKRGHKRSMTQLANGTHPWQNITHDQRVENGKKGAETLGADGLYKKNHKSAMTQLSNGNHPFQNLTDKQKSDKAKKSAETKKLSWVFVDSDDNYLIHNLYWNKSERLKSKSLVKLCRYSDWYDYCSRNSMDPSKVNFTNKLI